MVKAQPGRDRMRLAVSGALGGGKEAFFFHADVLEQACAELSIRSLVDFPKGSSCPLEQISEPDVVISQKLVKRSMRKNTLFPFSFPPLNISKRYASSGSHQERGNRV